MSNAYFKVPQPINEPVKSYKPGSPEREELKKKLVELKSKQIEVPLIIGGGIIEPEKAYRNCKAGADLIVVGNAIEKDAALIKEMAAAIHSVPVKVI